MVLIFKIKIVVVNKIKLIVSVLINVNLKVQMKVRVKMVNYRDSIYILKIVKIMKNLF